MTKAEAYSKGFDAGNYGSAYESETWAPWIAKRRASVPTLEPEAHAAYLAGMLCGFFSSYELHEIGCELTRETVQAFRKAYGEES